MRISVRFDSRGFVFLLFLIDCIDSALPSKLPLPQSQMLFSHKKVRRQPRHIATAVPSSVSIHHRHVPRPASTNFFLYNLAEVTLSFTTSAIIFSALSYGSTMVLVPTACAIIRATTLIGGQLPTPLVRVVDAAMVQIRPKITAATKGASPIRRGGPFWSSVGSFHAYSAKHVLRTGALFGSLNAALTTSAIVAARRDRGELFSTALLYVLVGSSHFRQQRQELLRSGNLPLLPGIFSTVVTLATVSIAGSIVDTLSGPEARRKADESLAFTDVPINSPTVLPKQQRLYSSVR